MKLSREARYGLEGLALLARKPEGTVMLLNDIAAERGLPRVFLAKIFQKLTQHGVLRSFRGTVRGYALARPPGEIRLDQIFGAIEGRDLFDHCLFWSDHCAEDDPCPLHHHWKKVQRPVVEAVMGLTLADVAPRSRSVSAVRRGRRTRSRRS